MSEATKIKVLFVDDDEIGRRAYANMLKKGGYEVVVVDEGAKALREVQAQRFDVVLTDFKMPKMNGEVLIDRLREIQPDIVPIIVTAFPTMDLAINAVRKGVGEFLTKPLDVKELQNVIQKVLARREEEVQRIQRRFAEELIAMEKKQGSSFEPRAAIKALMDLDAPAPVPPAKEGETRPPSPVPGEGEVSEPCRRFVIVLCEPISRNPQLLKDADTYRHFRAIYTAHKILQDHLKKEKVAAELQLIVVRRPLDIAKLLCRRRLLRQVCCVIIGPNYAGLSEATVRLTASWGRGRLVVVCHNAEQAQCSWGCLVDLSQKLGIRTCRSYMDEHETRAFWSSFFVRELKPFIECRTGRHSAQPGASGQAPSLGEELRELLSGNGAAAISLPGLPDSCQQALHALEEDRSFAELDAITRPDAELQTSILCAANMARYGTCRQLKIKSVSQAIAMIGMEETKKITLGRIVGQLVSQVDPASFNPPDFFLHSAGVGYLAQLLSLDMENPSRRDQEILQGLKLPQYAGAVLKEFRCWQAFKCAPGFDAFAAGMLHDAGKAVNAICYKDAWTLVLYGIEQHRWASSLLESEVAVVGDFHHPATGGALLENWEILPQLIEPIRAHHQIHPGSPSEPALIALANCLVKGLYPFPRAIAIPDEYRRLHLGPAPAKQLLANPLPLRYQRLAGVFEKGKKRLSISREDLAEGLCAPAAIQGLISAAQEAVQQDNKAYVLALIRQNPELLDVVEWSKVKLSDLIALSLLLKDLLEERVNQLFQNTKSTFSSARPSRAASTQKGEAELPSLQEPLGTEALVQVNGAGGIGQGLAGLGLRG